mmetsp:Transcript_36354/g.93729  ORF Transcript_36354/g.93729 Transcript_36354/m.93729 type:complete len:244 (+) Transcript_36354:1491-2222(+)
MSSRRRRCPLLPRAVSSLRGTFAIRSQVGPGVSSFITRLMRLLSWSVRSISVFPCGRLPGEARSCSARKSPPRPTRLPLLLFGAGTRCPASRRRAARSISRSLRLRPTASTLEDFTRSLSSTTCMPNTTWPWGVFRSSTPVLVSLYLRVHVPQLVGEFGAGEAQLPTRGRPWVGTSSARNVTSNFPRGDKSELSGFSLRRCAHDRQLLQEELSAPMASTRQAYAQCRQGGHTHRPSHPRGRDA